jgi:hypothetical protein
MTLKHRDSACNNIISHQLRGAGCKERALSRVHVPALVGCVRGLESSCPPCFPNKNFPSQSEREEQVIEEALQESQSAEV